MELVRVTDPGVFRHPTVREFFVEAATANNFGNPEAIAADISQMVQQPDLGCFVVVSEEGPQALVAIMLPQSAFMECPQVLMVYGKSREATKLVVDAALQFGTNAGYAKAWGLNRSGGTDEALERLFGHVGFVRPIGTVLEYEV